MEGYKQTKQNINNNLLFKLSQIGYALNCDLMFTNRVGEIEQNINLANELKNGDKVFISVLDNEITINIKQLVGILSRKNVKVYFYLMYEPIIPVYVIELLLPCSLGLYINNNVYEHPLIHCMPIGIRDCEKVVPNHKGFSHDYLFREGGKLINKQHLCLLCF